MSHELVNAPWGYDVWIHKEVVPKSPPAGRLLWRIGPVSLKTYIPVPVLRRGQPRTPATGNEDITVQLTADQQVELSVGAEDAYGNPVDITGANVAWASSDESIISLNVDRQDETKAIAVAVGPAGTASVTVSGGTGQQYQGSLAIDVVAGDVTEIVVTAGTPTDKTT